jgi:hypothetical protein
MGIKIWVSGIRDWELRKTDLMIDWNTWLGCPVPNDL